LDVCRLAAPYESSIRSLVTRRAQQHSFDQGLLGGGKQAIKVTGGGSVLQGLDPCIVSARPTDGVVPMGARVKRRGSRVGISEKSRGEQPVTWWNESVYRSSLESASTGLPGELLCACGCGARWGEFSSMPAHRGFDQRFSSRLRAMTEAGRTHAVMPDPDYELGEGGRVVDTRGWRLSPKAVPALATVLTSTRAQTLVLGEHQGLMQTEKSMLQLLSALPCV